MHTVNLFSTLLLGLSLLVACGPAPSGSDTPSPTPSGSASASASPVASASPTTAASGNQVWTEAQIQAVLTCLSGKPEAIEFAHLNNGKNILKALMGSKASLPPADYQVEINKLGNTLRSQEKTATGCFS